MDKSKQLVVVYYRPKNRQIRKAPQYSITSFYCESTNKLLTFVDENSHPNPFVIIDGKRELDLSRESDQHNYSILQKMQAQNKLEIEGLSVVNLTEKSRSDSEFRALQNRAYLKLQELSGDLIQRLAVRLGLLTDSQFGLIDVKNEVESFAEKSPSKVIDYLENRNLKLFFIFDLARQNSIISLRDSVFYYNSQRLGFSDTDAVLFLSENSETLEGIVASLRHLNAPLGFYADEAEIILGSASEKSSEIKPKKEKKAADILSSAKKRMVVKVVPNSGQFFNEIRLGGSDKEVLDFLSSNPVVLQNIEKIIDAAQ